MKGSSAYNKGFNQGLKSDMTPGPFKSNSEDNVDFILGIQDGGARAITKEVKRRKEKPTREEILHDGIVAFQNSEMEKDDFRKLIYLGHTSFQQGVGIGNANFETILAEIFGDGTDR